MSTSHNKKGHRLWVYPVNMPGNSENKRRRLRTYVKYIQRRIKLTLRREADKELREELPPPLTGGGYTVFQPCWKNCFKNNF